MMTSDDDDGGYLPISFERCGKLTEKPKLNRKEKNLLLTLSPFLAGVMRKEKASLVRREEGSVTEKESFCVCVLGTTLPM